jgi:ABC-type spermidine/putrescine transport system permease subunit II
MRRFFVIKYTVRNEFSQEITFIIRHNQKEIIVPIITGINLCLFADAFFVFVSSSKVFSLTSFLYQTRAAIIPISMQQNIITQLKPIAKLITINKMMLIIIPTIRYGRILIFFINGQPPF